MLCRYFEPFIEYLKLADFADRSVEAIVARINEFQSFLTSKKIRAIKKITYQHLVLFAADFQAPSMSQNPASGCYGNSIIF